MSSDAGRGPSLGESADRAPVAGVLVLPDGVVRGRIHVDGERIARIEQIEPVEPAESGARVDRAGTNDSPRAPIPELMPGEYFVVPGFIDIHVHGGGGGSFDGPAEQALTAARFHLAHGTTSLLASLVSARFDQLSASAARLAPLIEDGVLAGVHLEGPFLNPERRGAQPAQALTAPDAAALEAILRSAPGAVRMLTFAPELPGADELTARLADHGVVAAIGHCAASYQQCRRAFDAGARVATHLFNGMTPVHHRDGGTAVAALLDDRVVCELIVDRHHVADEMVALVFRAAGADRIALITDAIAASGAPAGQHTLGGQAIEIADGCARLAGGGSLAGSLLSMDAAVRNAVRYAGVPLIDAVRAATLTPARAIGIDTSVGSLAAGKRADLCLLDSDLDVAAVMRGGRWQDR